MQQLSDRFMNLVQQQLSSFESEQSVQRLVVYFANTKGGQSPTLEAIGHWPIPGNSLPPLETDQELRAPSPDRRWYPLQEGTMLLGVLRAERLKNLNGWPESLDQRLQSTASALTHCLSLELEKKKLLEELNHQQEQIGLMVHQLRNPLTALRTYAELLLRRIGSENQNRTLVEGLLSEQDQLNRYVNALDGLSQKTLPYKEAHQDHLLLPPLLPDVSDINVRSLLTPLIDRAATTSRFQGRDWKGPSDWPTWTEEPRPSREGVIAEIVANLLENAFRYSPQSASIGLHLMNDGICIWDSGIPIKQEEVQRIFQRGYRGKNSQENQGSGLGLALGREFAEQLGGTLDLISSPRSLNESLPLVGNAFVLSIPIEPRQV